jgi:hypothetical protein
MARALTAYLAREKVPARKPLQAAIDALGFPMKLDADYAPFETAGYLPCDLDGEDAGFDLRFKDVAAAATFGGRDVALALKWGGDPREEAAASLFCAALAKDFGALVLRDEAETGFDVLIATAKKALA